jgi:hypothetical protein
MAGKLFYKSVAISEDIVLCDISEEWTDWAVGQGADVKGDAKTNF